MTYLAKIKEDNRSLKKSIELLEESEFKLKDEIERLKYPKTATFSKLF